MLMHRTKTSKLFYKKSCLYSIKLSIIKSPNQKRGRDSETEGVGVVSGNIIKQMEEERHCSPITTPAAELILNTNPQSPPQQPPPHNKEIEQVVERLLRSGNLDAQIEAAKDVRKLVRRSKSSSSKTRSRLAAAGVIPPLVSMLHQPSAREPALIALLNLAVRNERSVFLFLFFFFMFSNCLSFCQKFFFLFVSKYVIFMFL